MSDRLTALRLAAAVPCDPRPAAKWLRGEPVSRFLAARLEQTARSIGVERPSAPPASPSNPPPRAA